MSAPRSELRPNRRRSDVFNTEEVVKSLIWWPGFHQIVDVLPDQGEEGRPRDFPKALVLLYGGVGNPGPLRQGPVPGALAWHARWRRLGVGFLCHFLHPPPPWRMATCRLTRTDPEVAGTPIGPSWNRWRGSRHPKQRRADR